MKAITLLISFVLFSLFANAQSLIEQIAENSQVHSSSVGYGSNKSPQYQRYEELRANTSIAELIKLTRHESPVVACYAGWALVDKEYDHLQDVLIYFIENDKEVTTFKGCIVSSAPISSEFYHRYWNKIRLDSKNEGITLRDDEQLIKMDSVILYQQKPYWLILDRALKNREYSKEYLKRIKYIAFNNRNLDAIEYLFKHNLEGNEKSIQAVAIKYLQRKKVWPNEYEVIFDILLSFKDEELNKLVLEELKKMDENEIYPGSKHYSKVLIKHGVYTTSKVGNINE